ncbi:ABC transporter permease [Hymenobacter caeli]|uniref:ABC transport system permease protein n=1 Tax=Hymenobacter caeli TaxID=2735894 RepID=A0ABX2FLE1_9BACT|nr:ABC transporter permease [Hymenobacter caeli]NRT17953.1 putative ABC transport system permease protein [Hymenobacter caeli]
MIRHLLKIIWHRKRANALLIAELFLSFLVLFGLGTLVAVAAQGLRRAPGFAYADVWELRLSTNNDPAAAIPTVARLLAQLRATPGVADVSLGAFGTPFSTYSMSVKISTGPGGPPLAGDEVEADHRFAPLLQMAVLEGRWFEPHENSALRPVVINRELRQALFPHGPALGQRLQVRHFTTGQESGDALVVGVVGSYRAGGDLGAPGPVVFTCHNLADSASHRVSYTLLVRVRPGSGAALEERLVRTVAAVAKTWSTGVISLADSRAAGLQTALAPIIAGALVSGFLLLNVALGLFGALWQTISRRRAEIGLRRAVGATGPGISGQFVAETLIITTLAVGPGVLVAVQFPLLGVFGLPAALYGVGLALAVALVYAFAAVCAAQPSWQAAGIRPAVALREE